MALQLDDSECFTKLRRILLMVLQGSEQLISERWKFKQMSKWCIMLVVFATFVYTGLCLTPEPNNPKISPINFWNRIEYYPIWELINNNYCRLKARAQGRSHMLKACFIICELVIWIKYINFKLWTQKDKWFICLCWFTPSLGGVFQWVWKFVRVLIS